MDNRGPSAAWLSHDSGAPESTPHSLTAVEEDPPIRQDRHRAPYGL